MATDISLTAGMRSNLLQLQQTSKLLDRTQTRLATGKEINSALDGPTAFFQSKALTDKAGDLDLLKDDMGQAISGITAADGAITSIASLVEQAKGLITSAKTAGTTSERLSLANQFNEIRSQIDSLANDTNYNGINLVNGRTGISNGVYDQDNADLAENILNGIDDITVASADTGTAKSYTISVDTKYDLGAVAATTTTVLTDPLDTDSISVSIANATVDYDISTVTLTVNGNASSITVSDGTNSAAVAITTADGDTYSVSLGIGSNTYTVAWAQDEGGVTSSVAYVNDATFSLSITSTAEADITVTDGTTSETTNVTADAADLSFLSGEIVLGTVDLESLADNDSATIEMSPGNTGTSDDDLVVLFNEDGSSQVRVFAVDASSGGLNLSAARGDWATNDDVNASSAEIDWALDQLRSYAKELANNLAIIQTREDFTTIFVNTLEEGSDKLVLADTNEEGANMLMLQTRQQLSINSLSLAASAAQSVLQLFR